MIYIPIAIQWIAVQAGSCGAMKEIYFFLSLYCSLQLVFTIFGDERKNDRKVEGHQENLFFFKKLN
jgi:hypothetical protein